MIQGVEGRKKKQGRRKESEKREELSMILRGHALYTGGTARFFQGRVFVCNPRKGNHSQRL